MSGIVGFVNLDEAQADDNLLRRMTAAMAFRGPDAKETYCVGPAGLGTALLRTTFEAEHERQPCTLDGLTWVICDARIDARAELKRELESAGRSGLASATDAQLILHAWHAWGERSVEHLLGDFAFAVWDAPLRRLFCARDHFGVKQFYYSLSPSSIVFGNTLDAIRLHPGVAGDLNELALADFLLFGWNQDTTTTTFRGIASLPAAHALLLEPGEEPRTWRYWALQPEDAGYAKDSGRAERLAELLDMAVADRLRTRRAAALVSGGLGSSSVAASAVRLLDRQSPPGRLRACTSVLEADGHAEEPQLSGLLARHLGIPIEYVPADGDLAAIGPAAAGAGRTPEPLDHASWGRALDLLALAAEADRVVLTGEGAAACLAHPSSFWALRKRAAPHQLPARVARYWMANRRLPATGLGAWAGRNLGIWERDEFPSWLSPELVRRHRLRERWEELSRPAADAHDALTWAFWQNCAFPSYDAESSRLPLEPRHPFFDVRLVRFLLGLPELSWSPGKELLREAMAPRLPEALCRPAKAPAAIQTAAAAPAGDAEPPPPPPPAEPFVPPGPEENWLRFVDREALQSIVEGTPPRRVPPREKLRVVSLISWLARESARTS